MPASRTKKLTYYILVVNGFNLKSIGNFFKRIVHFLALTSSFENFIRLAEPNDPCRVLVSFQYLTIQGSFGSAIELKFSKEDFSIKAKQRELMLCWRSA